MLACSGVLHRRESSQDSQQLEDPDEISAAVYHNDVKCINDQLLPVYWKEAWLATRADDGFMLSSREENSCSESVER